ncbi:hypothetical protein F5B22DRAFT_351024 [Xylaria bambusicola]|uniref:uncharacterized protein n=1 Tax=Xylaria bambusicola TaxID=326684 RepID=UPI002007D37F|nr:uncharacterized protein F5B22DRAFT_351024 [Xylaria bambusicola]KAI0525601.1 hypothetical protein F5B22DRAFT_351024 [Xylaria bambusicola]
MDDPGNWLKVSHYTLRILSDSACQHVFHALGLCFEITIHPDGPGERVVMYGLEEPTTRDGDPKVVAKIGLGDSFEKDFNLCTIFDDEGSVPRDHVLLPDGSSLSQCIHALRRYTREVSLGFIAQLLSGAAQTKPDKGKGKETADDTTTGETVPQIEPSPYYYNIAIHGRSTRSEPLPHHYNDAMYRQPTQSEPSPNCHTTAMPPGGRRQNPNAKREKVVAFLEECLEKAHTDLSLPPINVQAMEGDLSLPPINVQAMEGESSNTEEKQEIKRFTLPAEWTDEATMRVLALDSQLKDFLGMRNEEEEEKEEEEEEEEEEESEIDEETAGPSEAKKTEPARSAGLIKPAHSGGISKKKLKSHRRHKAPK